MKTNIDVQKQTDPELVYAFKGELDETNVDPTFQPIYKELENDWTQVVVFDFKELTYLNSKAIGYITDIYSHADTHNGKLILRNLSPEVYDILDIVGITSIVEIENGPESE